MLQRAREAEIQREKRQAREKQAELEVKRTAPKEEPLVDHGSSLLEQMEAELAGSLTSYFEVMEADLENSLMDYLHADPVDEKKPNDEEEKAVPADGVHDGVSVGEAAFEAAVQLCEEYERGPQDRPLSADVPALLRRAFDADFAALQLREKLTQNVTCMQPHDEGRGYELFDDALQELPLKPGRVCEGGACGEACSRVTFPVFSTPEEALAFRTELDAAITPPVHHFELTK